MNKIKYFAAVLIGMAGLGLQQATADTIDNTQFQSTLTNSNQPATGTYGTVTVTSLDVTTQTASITFQANTAGGFYFIDGNIVDVNLTGNSATLVSGSVVESPAPGSVSDFSSVQYNAQVDGFGNFTVVLNNGSANNKIMTVTFQVTNTSGTLWTSTSNVLAFNPLYDAAAHYIDTNIPAPNTFFTAESSSGHTVPDGGTTVMLLGVALGALGVVRRYLVC